MIDPTLASLAKAAGILVHWKDAFGNPQATNPDSLRAVLTALGLPVATDRQVRESRVALKDSAKATVLPALVTAVAGDVIVLPSGAATPARYRIDCEDGQRIDGMASVAAGGKVTLPPVAASGYHRLVLDQGMTTLAVAPHRCFGIADSPGRARTWGAIAQLYALRQAGDGGIGSYGALATLARALAKEGADALAVSPVHAMFANDPARYSPYAPSNRLFLNVLHVDVIELCKLAGVDPDVEPAQHDEALELIDWPAVSAARLSLMRQAFDALTARGLLYPDAPLGRDFAAFRRVQGVALERHARFEALQA
ncbi:4-alpha-glucanotransferase, partial [Vineibacter terrae]|uniref:4-alpha-glucanotransferase n=1 Tax=Vineibacter terrae TaxID=2586908 RepID=UPI002E339749